MTDSTRHDYIRRLFAPESASARKIRESVAGHNDQISIHPEEGRFLQFLIRLAGVRSIVEIGTLAGYSAQWMVEALPPEGRLYTLEKDAARAALARENLADPRIDFLAGEALRTLETLAREGPFDMVFIDADKLNYAHYLDWAEKNVRKGGLIVGDNTFLFDAVWMETPPERVRQTALEAMRAFNERLADPQKYTGILLPTEEGLTAAIKNF